MVPDALNKAKAACKPGVSGAGTSSLQSSLDKKEKFGES